MRVMMSGCAALLCIWSVAATGQDKGANPNKSQAVVDKYLDAFKKTGVPTPGAVDAAVAQAKRLKTVEAWGQAANLANSYANVVSVLKEHYGSIYDRTKSRDERAADRYLDTGVKYEAVQNRYLKLRDDAYLEIARIHLAKGDKASALSFAAAAVELSGIEPNTAGEALIRQIIEYKD